MKDQRVFLSPCPSYETGGRQALEACLCENGLLDWVKSGMTIAVKVNLVTGKHPDAGVTTHPVLVRELARLLTERGARVVIGDSPGVLFTKAHVQNVYRLSGMEKAVMEGVRLNDDFSVKNAFFKEGVSLGAFTYTGWLDQADAIINFAKFKTHAMLAMSCSVKNIFGVIPGATKPEYHMRFPDTMAFSNMLVDLQEYFKPVIHIVDAVVGMEGNGPTAGSARKVGALLASRNPYALDMVCADLMGLTRNDVPYLRAAWERGLGPADLSETVTDADLDMFRPERFRLVTRSKNVTFSGDSLRSKLYAAVGAHVLATKPGIDKHLCVLCGKCASICPAGAITIGKGPLRIDRSKCIRCFCCQEFCPKGAMQVTRHPIGKIITVLNRT